MNKNQIAQVQGHVEAFFQAELSKKLSEAYPDATQSQKLIGNYTVKEFLSLSNKVFNQFQEELKDVYIKALPFQYQYQNEFGGGELNADLAAYLSHITQKQFPHAANILSRLIHYQAVNGFWEKSKRKYFRAHESNLAEEKERITLVAQQLDNAKNQLSQLFETVEGEKEKLNSFTQKKQKQLSEIESLLESVRAHNSEASNLHTNATSLVERISAILQSAEEKKEESDELLSESKSLSHSLSKALEEQSEKISFQNEAFERLKSKFSELISKVEEKTTYFEERNTYLDDLIEREVGASLFETFKQRKLELQPSVQFWKWAVPVTAVATILWIFFLFGNGDISKISYQALIVNSIKALPAVGILLFSIAQYSKERQFQEEYAFKSAVALTVNSYAAQIEGKEEKDNLIIQSVSSIYRTPISTPKTDTKETKELFGAVRELKSIVTDLVSKK